MATTPLTPRLEHERAEAIEINRGHGRRWDAWGARGLVRDRRMLRRMRWVGGLLVAAIVTCVGAGAVAARESRFIAPRSWRQVPARPEAEA